MPTRQDIDAGTAVNLAGTVPGGHGLATIRQQLLEAPRSRQWVIGEVVNMRTAVDHPDDDDDKNTPTIKFVDLVGITDATDIDQLSGMRARARAQMPGQGSLDEAQ